MTYQEWRPIWKAGLAHASSCIQRIQRTEIHPEELGDAESARAIVTAVATLLCQCRQYKQAEALLVAMPSATVSFVAIAIEIDSLLETRPDLQRIVFSGATQEHWRLLGLVVSTYFRLPR
jgi:hypothetical protein